MNGRYVRYEMATDEQPQITPIRNAFTVLMDASKQLKLPAKTFSTPERYEIGRGDHRLHDDIIDFLKERGLGFSPGTENTTGKQVVKALCDALFFIQPHLTTLCGRITSFIPTYFNCLMQRVYNDPQQHKHAIAPIKREALSKIGAPLYDLMLLPVMQASRWQEFSTAVDALAKNIDKYKEYLEQQVEKMQKAHQSPSPVRSFGDGKSSHVKFILGAATRKPNLITRYKILEEFMFHLKEYDEPVFLNDFSPNSARQKYTYIHELSLPFKIEMYCYQYGNNLGSLWYAWKVPANAEKYDPTKSQQLIASIEKNIKQYHSREMKRQFIHRFGLVVHCKPSVMMEMYQFLTGDASTTNISEAVQQKLKFLLDSQDPEIIYDLRDVNPGRPQKYEPFWRGVEALINEKALAAVDSRRHGMVCHFALAFSVKDLRDQVVERNPDIEVPSIEWIRVQFWPRNPFQKAAARYTGRLQLKHMVQSQQLHADHIDGHYAAAIFKYLKKFAIP